MKNALWPNLFRNWNRTESETVYTLRQVAGGDFVFKNRAPGEGMYIIMKGTIKITIGTRSGDEKVLAELKEGDFFGELALFDNEPRSANALATTDSKLIGFFTADLLSLQDRNPQMTNKILMNLGSMLGERLRSTNHLLLEAQIKSHDEADTAD